MGWAPVVSPLPTATLCWHDMPTARVQHHYIYSIENNSGNHPARFVGWWQFHRFLFYEASVTRWLMSKRSSLSHLRPDSMNLNQGYRQVWGLLQFYYAWIHFGFLYGEWYKHSSWTVSLVMSWRPGIAAPSSYFTHANTPVIRYCTKLPLLSRLAVSRSLWSPV